MNYTLGVDIGTSGTKAVAFGDHGEVIAGHRIGYPLLNPQPGYVEQDPDTLFDAVIGTIAQTVREVRERNSGSHLLGVGFSSAMHGLMAVDADGRPLTPCITWADTRSEAFATRLRYTPEGRALYTRTGTPIHPMSPLVKLGWWRDHEPDLLESAYKLISIKEYVFYRLFGRYVVDQSIASATGLFDIHTLEWHAPALALAGITPERLSEPVPITEVFTGMDLRYAQAMQLPPDTPFIVGGSDGCLANLGALAVRPGDAVTTIGTSGAVRVISDRPMPDPLGRTFSYVLTDRMYVSGGAVNNGGVVLRWFNENFGPVGVTETEAYRQLAKAAEQVPAGADGLLFLPYLTGERAPHWDANAKGLFFGVQLHHTKAHFARAVFEGVVFGIHSVVKVLEENCGPIRMIHANGGFARSSFWVQLLADVSGRDVQVAENAEGAAAGASFVVLRALGHIRDFAELADRKSEGRIYSPDSVRHAFYIQASDRFERLYRCVKDEFANLDKPI